MGVTYDVCMRCKNVVSEYNFNDTKFYWDNYIEQNEEDDEKTNRENDKLNYSNYFLNDSFCDSCIDNFAEEFEIRYDEITAINYVIIPKDKEIKLYEFTEKIYKYNQK